jgi:hypothetical protein
VNEQTDVNNCGACGQACKAGVACVAGVCAVSGQLEIRVYIDGRSDAVIQGNTIDLRNLDYAAPGRWNGSNNPTTLTFGGSAVNWMPTWPDQPTAENRNCDCNSSIYTGIPPLAPHDQTVQLAIKQARYQASITQQPSAANNDTLIVEFNDDPIAGPDWYDVVLTYSSY